MVDLVLEQDRSRQVPGGGKGEKSGKKEVGENSESLALAARIQTVFDGIYGLSGEQVAAYLSDLESNGLPRGFVGEAREFCRRTKDFHDYLSGPGEEGKSRRRDEFLVDGVRLPGAVRVGTNPLAVELFMDGRALKLLWSKGKTGGFCDSVVGFASGEAKVKPGTHPALNVPLVCVEETRGAFSVTTQRHERTHIENMILARSKVAPDGSSFEDASGAAWKLYWLGGVFDDVAVFSSPEWDIVQKYADTAMVDELIANWLSGKPWADVRGWFHSALTEDLGLYNFFTRHLEIPRDSKYFRFIWNTYGQRVEHCVQAAFKLCETYERDPRMAMRSRILGRALSTISIDKWGQYLEDEGLVAEGEAIISLLETAGKDVFPADFSDQVVTVGGVAYETHAEFDRLTALEASRFRVAEEQKDRVFNTLLEHPERIVTGQALRGKKKIEAVLVR